MAKVSLREYNRDIENMIEGGQLDEAVVHCQYILKAFPMHVETYRLLGKAFLEARRYTEAADIFQRILMAVPDDFVAHVGMSIIRDNEDKLDDSIWHMERAFEVQPSNPAIQSELRRLYGRRDGVEPPKIRLSRDALANMYSQGELFNQAIAEIRSVLAEDLNRPDLQVMLARAYYRAGQKVEAAEMAAALLKKYPYCMDALRVLVDVLPSATRSDNIQVYRRRLRLLDPYSPFATDSVFASDQVADAAVNLERLDYGRGSASGLPQSDWATSLGIKLSSEKSKKPRPEQIQAETTAKSLPPFIAGTIESSSTPAAEGGSVPDWMRAAGWQESAGVADRSTTTSDEEPSAEPILPADIPDWLKAMAPPEMTGGATAEPEAISSEKAHSVEQAVMAKQAQAEEESASLKEPSGEIPEWLRQTNEQPLEPSTQETIATPCDSLYTESPIPLIEELSPETPSISDEVASDTEEITPSQAPVEGDTQQIRTREDTLAWLEQLAVDQGEKPEEKSSAIPPLAEVVPASPEQISEEDISITSWLSKLDADEITGKFPPASASAEQPVEPLEELPDWLKDLEKPVPVSESAQDDEGQELPTLEDENAPVSEQAAPTIPEEWVPVEKPAESMDQSNGPDGMAVEHVSVEVTGKSTPRRDKDDETLAGAQAALGSDALGDAMKEYDKLIKKGCLLDEVLHDLLAAIDRFPVDAIVWQTLGDAYMRANRLQDALDAYTKAEELVR
jgi:tetratricopeptide (TPR) repeat protein